MFCPNCGAGNKIEQNFCRFCGLNLQETVDSLSAQLSSGQNAGQLKKLETLKRLSDFIFLGLIIVVATWILVNLYAFLNGSAFMSGKVFLGVAAVFLILQSALGYFRRANTLGYADELEKTSSLRGHELKQRQTAKLLEDKPFIAAAVPTSVTENSTELLFAENKTRKLE